MDMELAISNEKPSSQTTEFPVAPITSNQSKLISCALLLRKFLDINTITHKAISVNMIIEAANEEEVKIKVKNSVDDFVRQNHNGFDVLEVHLQEVQPQAMLQILMQLGILAQHTPPVTEENSAN